eukprot:6824461-Ditylum_brightwellii.AAC.1
MVAILVKMLLGLFPGSCCNILKRDIGDLYQHLGSDIPSRNFQLNPSQINSNKATTGPDTDALNCQQNSYLNRKNWTEKEKQGTHKHKKHTVDTMVHV